MHTHKLNLVPWVSVFNWDYVCLTGGFSLLNFRGNSGITGLRLATGSEKLFLQLLQLH